MEVHSLTLAPQQLASAELAKANQWILTESPEKVLEHLDQAVDLFKLHYKGSLSELSSDRAASTFVIEIQDLRAALNNHRLHDLASEVDAIHAELMIYLEIKGLNCNLAAGDLSLLDSVKAVYCTDRLIGLKLDCFAALKGALGLKVGREFERVDRELNAYLNLTKALSYSELEVGNERADQLCGVLALAKKAASRMALQVPERLNQVELLLASELYSRGDISAANHIWCSVFERSEMIGNREDRMIAAFQLFSSFSQLDQFYTASFFADKFRAIAVELEVEWEPLIQRLEFIGDQAIRNEQISYANGCYNQALELADKLVCFSEADRLRIAYKVV